MVKCGHAVWYTQCAWHKNAARGLVYPQFVGQTIWFGVLNVCSAKGEWVEHGIEHHEVRNNNNV